MSIGGCKRGFNLNLSLGLMLGIYAGLFLSRPEISNSVASLISLVKLSFFFQLVSVIFTAKALNTLINPFFVLNPFFTFSGLVCPNQRSAMFVVLKNGYFL